MHRVIKSAGRAKFLLVSITGSQMFLQPMMPVPSLASPPALPVEPLFAHDANSSSWFSLHAETYKAYKSGDYGTAERLSATELKEAELLPQGDDRLISTLQTMAAIYWAQSKFEDAEQVYLRLLSIASDSNSYEPMRLAWLLELHGQTLLYQDKYAYAEPELRKALGLLEQIDMKEQHVFNAADAADLVVSARYSLAHDLEMQKKYAEAEQGYKQVIEVEGKTSFPKSSYVTDSLLGLGGLYIAMSRYPEAEPFLRQALSRLERRSEANRNNLCECLQKLSMVCQEQGKIVESEKFFKRYDSLMSRKSEGPSRKSGKSGGGSANAASVSGDRLSSGTQKQMGSSQAAELLDRVNDCLKSSKFDEADRVIEQLITLAESQTPLPQVDFQTQAGELIDHWLFPKPARAEELARRLLALQERGAGSNDEQLVARMKQLAFVLSHEKKYGEAESLYKRAAVILEKEGKQLDESLLMELVDAYQQQGKLTEAEELCKTRIAGAEKASGPDSLAVSFPLYQLGTIYRDGKRLNDAERCFKRAVLIEDGAYGELSANSRSSLTALASTLIDENKIDEALPLYQRLIRIEEHTARQFGKAMPNLENSSLFLSLSVQGLAECYAAKGDFAQAEAAYKRSLALDEKDCGATSAAVANGLLKLARLYDTAGNNAQAETHYKRALSLLEQRRNEKDSGYGACVEAYASFLRKLNRSEEAVKIEREQ